MHTNINYNNRANPERDAVRDLCEWFGFRRALLIARCARNVHRIKDPTEGLRQLDIAINFGGVSGYPIFCAFRRWVEPSVYQQWYDSLPD